MISSRAAAAPARSSCALALGLILLLAGCGGSSDDGSPGAAPSAPAASETASSEPAPSEPAPAADGTEYVDDDGFAITFPDDWEIRPDALGAQVAAVFPDQQGPTFADNVTVVFEDTTQTDLTVQDYLDLSAQNAPQQLPSFVPLDQRVVDGVGYFEYTATVQEMPLHFLAGVVVDEGRAYVATFSATPESFEAREPVARSVLETLRAT